MSKKIFITTAIDYTNDVIHIGHAYEKILADVFARFQRNLLGNDNIHYTTGTDEHGTTSQKAAEKNNVSCMDLVTKIYKEDKEQIDSLNISYDRFIRTTDEDHKKQALDFFKKVFDNGDIYKAKYEGYYCEGCEAHKTLSELNEKGQCPNHPTREIQKLDEENYFFRWSKYTRFLKDLIIGNTLVVLPEGKRKEMVAFLDNGLKDITVSRPKYKVSWGITTPIDENQVIYVWFDALINYLTEGIEKGFWDKDTEIIHFVGKDIARWHALLWPAMLKSAGYKVPDLIYIHGFINLNGQKISKSLGNVIRPTELVSQFGVDAVRYYLLKYGPIVEDSDISLDNFISIYNGELANGLGNTVSRIAKLASISEFDFAEYSDPQNVWEKINKKDIDEFRIDKILSQIWKNLSELDHHINEHQPWGIKDQEKLKDILSYEVHEVRKIASAIKPIMPDIYVKISKAFFSGKIQVSDILFPRISG
ncbi:methionine--tRNA ligase [candidate division WWE3 bacterium RBG_19FT_COMBO_34_6]|uniref:Methionine--tRNA ligase n=1 Tax=candidate division WWE3 bacterium RBG_19FT_COMBO_34_6 TaxID=1802612 RepID=A0A1F4UNK9_UNCKA|nr:MAG: methionine--tRNA ligase [candidate division WWE3 bacterium RBG_19FT_COMBO_34_6]